MPTLDSLFEALKLDHLAAQCDCWNRRPRRTIPGVVDPLTCEWQGRKQKGAEARLAQARLPWLKTLDSSTSASSRRSIARWCAS